MHHHGGMNHRLIPHLVLALVLPLGIGACDGGDPDASRDPARGQEIQSGCANELEALEGLADPLRGDVTGDGGVEDVYLALDPEGESGCQVFIVVEGEVHVWERHVLAVSEEGLDLGSVGAPRLLALADVDGRPGVEIAAVLLTGAATELVGFFTMGGGRLERLELEGGEAFGSLLPLGGTVAHSSNLICDRNDILTLVTATEQGGNYRIARTPYTLEDGALLADLSESASEGVPAEDIGEVADIAAPAFDGCPS